MMCEKCAKATNTDDGNIWCHVLDCKDGSEFEPFDIPVQWIRDQIRKNHGKNAAAWDYLLRLWKEQLFENRLSQQPVKKEDEYVRMHQDPTAAQKFWRNE